MLGGAVLRRGETLRLGEERDAMGFVESTHRGAEATLVRENHGGGVRVSVTFARDVRTEAEWVQ